MNPVVVFLAYVILFRRAAYSGRVEMGEDLMSIEIGDDIRVTRLARTSR
jgi:hypothetical protein